MHSFDATVTTTQQRNTWFFGVTAISRDRAGRDLPRLSQEVIQQLADEAAHSACLT